MPKMIDFSHERHQQLEDAAIVALRVGRMLMESGAKAAEVHRGATTTALGLGAEKVHFQVGYDSLIITVSTGHISFTRMTGIGSIGVNQRLNYDLGQLCDEVAKGGKTADDVLAAIAVLVADTKRHHWLAVSIAVGLACACFGRILGIDWASFLPVMAASAIGQILRHHLLRIGLNSFVMAAVVAFSVSVLAGLGAEYVGSDTIKRAVSASVLLLVPGVPVLNAQTDIMEGHPNLGSARAVSVLMVLIFLTVGMWMGETVLGADGLIPPAVHREVWHQAFFGAVAAAGFGILFNFGWIPLIWAACAGGLALTVRTVGLDAGWSLEVSSFIAAALVGLTIHVLNFLPNRITHANTTLAVAGCIPMIPGMTAAQGLQGMMGATTVSQAESGEALLMAANYGLTVVFTIGAIGTGLTIATHLFRPPASH